MSFVFWCIVLGILAGLFLGKNFSAPTSTQQPVNAPSAVDIWWKNLKHTPLSEYESKQIAETVAKWYMTWKSDMYMNHSWLCLGIEDSRVLFKQIYSANSNSGIKFAPQPTISYSHKISCQNDRELLASYILSAIRAKDPGCKLFLDGDSLILPTNSM